MSQDIIFAQSADLESILISEEELTAICDRIAREINEHYRPLVEAGEPLLVVGVLKGSVVFLADILRRINVPLQIEFLRASSYGRSSTSSGVVAIKHAPAPELIAASHVLVVEDILDTGNTLYKVFSVLREQGAKSVKLCTLLDKPSRRQADISADFVGREIPDAFVVGYGLDYADYYRNLPYIGILKPEIYSK
ncbi:MAG: hypoxanthine phosphoribosyltransferase [Clostridia bacterium]|nr:hypoxanthine phosphoribosyltransferase [Clostridia bacterium]